MSRHPHADIAIEWFQDTSRVVQMRDGDCWADIDGPFWRPNIEYRFKPQEDTWTPCKSGKLRFVPKIDVDNEGFYQLQQLMVNQKAEYKWMDVPVEEEDND